MLTLPNFLSLMRLPLALLFLEGSIPLRITALSLAAATDFLDGFIARRYNLTSRLGVILDPITDKIFVITALSFFLYNGNLSPFEAAAMLCRDFSVILFGFYLVVSGNFGRYQFRSIWSGKLTTTAQLMTLFALSLDFTLPSSLYTIFILLGVAALLELYLSD